MSDLYQVSVESLPGSDSIFITLSPIKNSEYSALYLSEFPQEELLSAFLKKISASEDMLGTPTDHFPSLARGLIDGNCPHCFTQKSIIDNVLNSLEKSKPEPITRELPNQPPREHDTFRNIKPLIRPDFGYSKTQRPMPNEKEVIIYESIKLSSPLYVNSKLIEKNKTIHFVHKGIL